MESQFLTHFGSSGSASIEYHALATGRFWQILACCVENRAPHLQGRFRTRFRIFGGGLRVFPIAAPSTDDIFIADRKDASLFPEELSREQSYVQA